MFFSYELLTGNGKFALHWKLGISEKICTKIMRKHRRQLLLNDLLKANRDLRDLLPVQRGFSSASLRLSTVLLHGIVINLDFKVTALIKKSEALNKRRNDGIDAENINVARITMAVNISEEEVLVPDHSDWGRVGVELPSVEEGIVTDLYRVGEGLQRHLLNEVDFPDEPLQPDIEAFDFPRATEDEVSAILNPSIFEDDQPAYETENLVEMVDQQNIVVPDQPADETENLVDMVDQNIVVTEARPNLPGNHGEEAEHMIIDDSIQMEEPPQQNQAAVPVAPADTEERRDLTDILEPPRKKKKPRRPPVRRLKRDVDISIPQQEFRANLEKSQATKPQQDIIQPVRSTQAEPWRKYLSASLDVFCQLQMRNEAFSRDDVEIERDGARRESHAQVSYLEERRDLEITPQVPELQNDPTGTEEVLNQVEADIPQYPDKNYETVPQPQENEEVLPNDTEVEADIPQIHDENYETVPQPQENEDLHPNDTEINWRASGIQRIHPEDVLDIICEIAEGTGATFFHEVCLQNEETRFDAASTFAALLRLEQKNCISCEQENCSDPILIKLNQVQDYVTSGSEKDNTSTP